MPRSRGLVLTLLVLVASAVAALSAGSALAATPPTIVFSTDNAFVSEDAGTATVTVRREGDLSVTNTVRVLGAFSGSGNRCDAIPGSDYLPVDQTLTFDPEVSERSFDVTILDDSDQDGSRTVCLYFYGADTHTGSPSEELLTIDDNDSTFEVSARFEQSVGGYVEAVAWGDYDSDGDLDGAVASSGDSDLLGLYENQGDGTFVRDSAADANLVGISQAALAWGDYDNDGRLDLLTAGMTEDGARTILYRQDDSGVFVDSGISFYGSWDGAAAFGDYNADGRQDILLSGFGADVYTNTGSSFALADVDFPPLFYSSAAWSDYDCDGDLDIVLQGEDSFAGSDVAKLYEYTDGSFVENSSVDLTGLSNGSVSWGDADSDGYPDLLLTGNTSEELPLVPATELYLNDEEGGFTQVEDSGLPGVGRSSNAAWGDYDSDGILDLALAGDDSSTFARLDVFRGNGDGTFSDDLEAGSFKTSWPYALAWGDYNFDGALDLLTGGFYETADLHQNQSGSALFADLDVNQAPNPPTNLEADPWDDEVDLHWDTDGDNPTDANGYQTAEWALSYAIRVGTSPGASDIVSPLSLSNGTRLVPQDGNAGEDTYYTVHNLPAGTYYWSAQAIDTSFAGSLFADEESFDVPASFAFDRSDFEAGEGDGTASITIDRYGSIAGTDTVEFSTTSDGDATPGSDYTPLTKREVTFAPGESEKTVTVSLGDDRVIEPDKTVSLELSLPGGSPSALSLDDPNTATLTIYDDDRSFSLSSTTYTVGEGGGPATIKIERDGNLDHPDTVYIATSNGTAIAGSDYTAVSRTVSFDAGDDEQTVDIPITDDSAIESAETVNLTLSSPSDPATLVSPQTATLTIYDDDRSFSLTSATYTVGEGDGSASIALTRAGASGSPVSVHLATSNGTATAGSDYTAVNQTVSFAAGETQKTVSIPIADDNQVESSETVHIALSSPPEGASLGDPHTAVLTITDNDKAPSGDSGGDSPAKKKPNGKIASAKLSAKSFPSSLAGKVKLSCKFSPKSTVFKWVVSLRHGKKWPAVKSVTKRGSFSKKTMTVKALFSGKKMRKGTYKLKLSADRNSKTLKFTIK